MLTHKTFYEYTPNGKRIRVKRFYYPEEKVWLCADCYHCGTDFIYATIPCERCQQGITQISVEKKNEK